jgi:trigger factor
MGRFTLKIEITTLEDQQTRMVAELEPEIMEKYRRQAARKISQTAKIPGFRPGKAPYDLVRRMIGDDRLTQEAVELVVDEIYPKMLAEANISPSGPGKLEEIISMEPPKFAFIVPLPPKIQIEDYKSIRKEYAPEPITEEQIEQTIKRLQRNYATAEPVERAAQQGDMVSFKLSAKRTQPEEGKSDTLLYEAPYQMIAGEEEEEEEETFPYKGFPAELVGLSAGEMKTFIHTFSDESPYEDLRGTEAEFTIAVENVKEMHPPEVNDEFAQSLGEFQTLDELKKTIRQQLEQNYSQQYDQNYYGALIEELIAKSTVVYRRTCWRRKLRTSSTNWNITWNRSPGPGHLPQNARNGPRNLY